MSEQQPTVDQIARLDALLAQVRELQFQTAETITTQANQLEEARRQQVIIALKDLPEALWIGQVRNLLHQWRSYDHPIWMWLQTHGFQGGYDRGNETIRILDAILTGLYDLSRQPQ